MSSWAILDAPSRYAVLLCESCSKERQDRPQQKAAVADQPACRGSTGQPIPRHAYDACSDLSCRANNSSACSCRPPKATRLKPNANKYERCRQENNMLIDSAAQYAWFRGALDTEEAASRNQGICVKAATALHSQLTVRTIQ